MAEYSAVYEVFAGTVAEGEAELEGLTPAQMAQRIDETAEPYAGVCHHCSHDINDPQVGELVSFTVDGKSYSKINGEWTEDE